MLAGILICLAIPALATEPDRDYFTAEEDPQAQSDLEVNDEHHTNLVLGWIRDARFDRALADIYYVLERWPNHPRALLLLEMVARLSYAPNLPLFHYERALNLYPNYALTHAQFGHYLVEIGKIDLGIHSLKRAVEIDPQLRAAHVWLSQAYDKHGDKVLAKKEAEQARNQGFQGKISPDLGDPPQRIKSK